VTSFSIGALRDRRRDSGVDGAHERGGAHGAGGAVPDDPDAARACGTPCAACAARAHHQLNAAGRTGLRGAFQHEERDAGAARPACAAAPRATRAAVATGGASRVVAAGRDGAEVPAQAAASAVTAEPAILPALTCAASAPVGSRDAHVDERDLRRHQQEPDGRPAARATRSTSAAAAARTATAARATKHVDLVADVAQETGRAATTATTAAAVPLVPLPPVAGA